MTAFLEDDVLPVFSVDEQGQVIYRNQAFDEFFGFPRPLMKGAGEASLYGLLKSEFNRYRSGLSSEPIFLSSAKACEGAYYEIQWRQMEPASGVTPFLVAFLKNVSEEEAAETKRQNLQRDSQAVIDAVPGVVFQYVVENESSGRFTYLSDSTRRYLGL
ncbi:MAG: hypothetical protein ACOCX1_04235, partial [Fimbriimonadaceae bacterium]